MLNKLYYVDPGSGFAFLQNTSYLWLFILGFLGGFVFLFKKFIKFLRKLWIFLLILIILITTFLLIQKNANMKNKTKLIVIGIDAMDANITERLLKEGALPNLERLSKNGSYARLKTTVPAESVVVWTSFLTGLVPKEHGIYDFIMRDPATYKPYLSLNETDGKNASLRRKGEPFWNTLSRNGITSSIYFCPNTFPPEELNGVMISGMGVPDALGFMGRFSFYTSEPLEEEDSQSRGKIIQIFREDDEIKTTIFGPKIVKANNESASEVPLKIVILPQNAGINVKFQGNSFNLKEGEWSPWLKVKFRIGFLNNLEGITRFYLKSFKDKFELYMSPINFNPRKPILPISYPASFSKSLSEKVGYFYTQGMPFDTWPLSEDRIDEKAFLGLSETIFNERMEILKLALEDFKNGFLFYYFEDLDMIQHMFWRYTDDKHSLFEENHEFSRVITEYYKKFDNVVGEIVDKLDEDAVLIVLSDHGFGSYRKSVNINRVLFNNGFLALEENIKEGKEFFKGVDWSRTEAYALGFGGIYLNISNRDKYGIVNEKDIVKLKEDVSHCLLKVKDPQTNSNIIKHVYVSENNSSRDAFMNMPDLFIGFADGYRASWQTALGGTPINEIENNDKKWSGDHLIDPVLVPGVIFSNREIISKETSILDLAPTILSVFGISIPDKLQGKPLLAVNHEVK
jgi:predicted AlkP superfamily phosphohydrolase/phosphomutase